MPRELRGAPWLPNIAPEPLELRCPPLPPEMPRPLRAPIPASTLLAVRGTPLLSLAPHSHPQPFLVPRALLPLPPMHPACFRASDSITNQYPHHHHTTPAPTPPGKGGKKKKNGGTATSPDPLSPHFLHSRPFPKCRVQNGDPAQPGEPLQSAERSQSGAGATLSLLSLLFVYDGPSRDVVYFRLFIGVIFFLFFFIFLAWGRQR